MEYEGESLKRGMKHAGVTELNLRDAVDGKGERA